MVEEFINKSKSDKIRTAMQCHISDMNKIKDMVVSKKFDSDIQEMITETISGCIENAESYLDSEKEEINVILNQLKKMNNLCHDIVLEDENPTDEFKVRFNQVMSEIQKIIIRH